MQRGLITLALIGLFLGSTAISSLADSRYPMHVTDQDQSSATMSDMHGMMGMPGTMMHNRGMRTEERPCQMDDDAGMTGMIGMMGHGMSGMRGSGRHGMMAHMFYLDRTEELGLSAEQVSKLKALHAACRVDNIRNVAEAKIARLELTDLLDTDNWVLKDAETLVRKVQKLEGDIQMRHLQGVAEARKLLTPEQLKQAASGSTCGDLENLFQ